jgi:FtsP/CotA-like multicopper oxidase with cupredoxin domain
MTNHGKTTFRVLSSLLVLLAVPAMAAPYVQCPANVLTQRRTLLCAVLCPTCNGFCNFNPRNPLLSTDPGCRNVNAANFYDTCKVQLDPVTGQPSGATSNPNVVCRSIACGDGHIRMADGIDMYIFGFSDVTNVPQSQIMTRGNPGADGGDFPNGYPLGAANFSAPTFFAREGQELYLTLTNTGMRERPDLFDPHTVHYHGFPNASSLFDGEPMASLNIGLGESLTYYYNNQFPGTYMWHCHVEAAEHMQMGMLGNLYITPRQDAFCASAPRIPANQYCFKDPARTTRWTGFAYNDGDASTAYDKTFFLQETAFDPAFHDADHTYQKIPFAEMTDRYAMFNGRGYPDTVYPFPITNVNGVDAQPMPAIPMTIDAAGDSVPAVIRSGDRVLLRLTSLSTVDFFTVSVPGIPMRLVGQGAQQLRGPTGLNTSFATNSVTLGGGEGVDIILDTTGVLPGTYFIYTTNLNYLNNDEDDYGGMMTELVVN